MALAYPKNPALKNTSLKEHLRDRDENTAGKRWWDSDVGDEEAFGIVTNNVVALNNTYSGRTTRLNAWYVLYTDTPDEETTDLDDANVRRDRRARFNVVSNACDSVHSRLTKNRPRPWVVTSGGKASLQQKAKQLNKYMDGEFSRMDLHEIGSVAGLDGLVFGTGAVKVYPYCGRPKAERVDIVELLIDPLEAASKDIRTLYQIKHIDRGMLKQMYPKHKGIVAAAGLEDDGQDSGVDDPVVSDMVIVMEAWHLASGPDADDGRHVICVDSGTLFAEEWRPETFPFAFFRWAEDPRGFWGMGLAERMAGTQSELNGLSTMISDSLELSVPSTWVEAGSGVKRDQIDNEPHRIYTYKGTPPLFMTPNPVSLMMLQREETLIERSYALQGISLLSASSMKPAGLNSGKALRNHHDIEAERFATAGRNWEKFFTDIARLVLECTRDLATTEKKEREHSKDKDAAKSKLEVFVGKSTLEAIAYTDVELGEAPYDVRVFPVSALSTTPQGRLQDVQDLIDLQVITDPNDIRELLDYPDLERFNDVESAGRKLADKMIEEALKGKAVAGNPYLPLEYTHRKAVLAWALSQYEEDGNEKGREALGNFIGHLESIMAKAEEAALLAQQQAAQAAAPPPQPAPGPGPMAGPQGIVPPG